MISGRTLALGIALTLYGLPPAKACESGHWVQSVADDGSIVVLEDGSVWEVHVDSATTVIWVPDTGIVACEDRLINVDDGEAAEAMRIR